MNKSRQIISALLIMLCFLSLLPVITLAGESPDPTPVPVDDEIPQPVRITDPEPAESTAKPATATNTDPTPKPTSNPSAIDISKDGAEAAVKLSKNTYTYDGKAKKPSVTLTIMIDDASSTDANAKKKVTLTKGTDYTVSYKNNKAIGTATVTIRGQGRYTGTLTATFKITSSPTETPAPSDNPFKDVSSKASYYPKIMWAYENGIVKGTSKTTFSPKDNCTRGQFALMLYRMAGKPDVSGIKNPFTDVKKSDPYYKAILWAYSKGIIKGTSKTTFSPNDSVTRGQIVLMLYRMAGKPEVSGSNPFKDVKKKNSCYKAVLWAYQNNITSGTSKTKFSPNTPCTRYQLVTFLYRFNQIMNFI